MSSGSIEISRNAISDLDYCVISTPTGIALVGTRRRKLIC